MNTAPTISPTIPPPTPTTTEFDLLNQYIRHGRNNPAGREALDTLIRLYVDYVFGIARRATRDHTLAEDVTQAVFLILAKKAPTIRHPAQLPSWLFQTTRYAAANAQRIVRRRAFHERHAARPEESPMPPQNLDPLPDLEDALANLPDRERHIILLRYFRAQEYPAIATALGISEPTARKRLSRGLERMRNFLASRTTTPATEAAIASGLTLAAAERASPTFAATLPAAILAGSVTPAILTLTKGTLMAMALTKAKIAAAITLTILAAGTLGIGIAHLAAAPTTSAPPPVTAATIPAQTNPAATLPGGLADGLTAQLVAIGDPTTGQWWLPDGTPTQAPYPPRTSPNIIPPPNPPDRILCFVTAIAYTNDPAHLPSSVPLLPNDVQHPSGMVSSNRGITYQTEYIRVPPNKDTLDFRIKFASKPDLEVLRLAPQQAAGIPQWTGQESVERDLGGEVGLLRLSSPRQVDDHVEIDALLPLNKDLNIFNYGVMPTFIRTDNKPFTFSHTNTPTRLYFDLPSTKLADLTEVRISLIHFDQYIEFQNISLRPNTLTDFKTRSGPTAPLASQPSK